MGRGWVLIGTSKGWEGRLDELARVLAPYTHLEAAAIEAHLEAGWVVLRHGDDTAPLRSLAATLDVLGVETAMEPSDDLLRDASPPAVPVPHLPPVPLGTPAPGEAPRPAYETRPLDPLALATPPWQARDALPPPRVAAGGGPGLGATSASPIPPRFTLQEGSGHEAVDRSPMPPPAADPRAPGAPAWLPGAPRLEAMGGPPVSPLAAWQRRADPPWVVALAALVPGLGHALLGRPTTGLMVLLGTPLVLPWIWSIVDAARVARRVAGGPLEEGKAIPWIAFFLSCWVAVLGAGLWSMQRPQVDPGMWAGEEVSVPPLAEEEGEAREGVGAVPAGRVPRETPEQLAQRQAAERERRDRDRQLQRVVADAARACAAEAANECLSLALFVLEADPTHRQARRLQAEALLLLQGDEVDDMEEEDEDQEGAALDSGVEADRFGEPSPGADHER